GPGTRSYAVDSFGYISDRDRESTACQLQDGEYLSGAANGQDANEDQRRADALCDGAQSYRVDSGVIVGFSLQSFRCQAYVFTRVILFSVPFKSPTFSPT